MLCTSGLMCRHAPLAKLSVAQQGRRLPAYGVGISLQINFRVDLASKYAVFTTVCEVTWALRGRYATLKGPRSGPAINR